ncbi:MAG: hypothetical protein D6689_10055, partial [Deltaproteobacteria bacterium]
MSVWVPAAVAAPPPPGPAATSAFGPRPEYAPGVPVTMVVDDFASIEPGITDQRAAEIAKAIAEWSARGIDYGAYYGFGAGYGDLDGARVDLDGTPVVAEVGGYMASPTRAAYRAWLIASGELAVDLGATHVFLDLASRDFTTLSFDGEVVAAFADWIGEPGFDIAAHLRSLGYPTTSALVAARDSGDPTLASDPYWQLWVAFDPVLERHIFEEWASALRARAAAYGRTVYLSGNRNFDGPDTWLTGDLFDYLISETFLDALGYPARDLAFQYKTAVAFGRRFWSWNFPNNTGSLNGTNDPWAQAPCNALDRLFVAQTFANGGLSQVCGAGWVYFHQYGYLPDEVAPLYLLVASHPELFDHPEAGEVALWFSEASERLDSGGHARSFRGASYLLSDAHRPWDVVFAADPMARDGAERLALADLLPYRAVVLAGARALTDEQIGMLEDYLDAGGVVIGFGPVGDLDATGADVSAQRTFDDAFGRDAVDTTRYAGTIVAFAQDLGAQVYDGAADAAVRAAAVDAWRAAVDPVVPPEIATDLPSTVHVTRFERVADGSHVYHLVNTDYDAAAGAVTPVPEGATFAVPVPPGFVGAPTVTLLQPGAAAQVIPAAVDGGMVTATLPALGDWTIAVVGSAVGPDAPVDLPPWSSVHTVDNALTTVDDALATGGQRPDVVDASGEILYPYWYWKGGNHGAVPFEVPVLATGAAPIATIELWYRYDGGEGYGPWTQYASVAPASPARTTIETISFDAPDGEGYYQMYVRAIDEEGRVEEVIAGPETGYGVDWTPPEPPVVTEASGALSGRWQEVTDRPVFQWTPPVDALSGPASANLSLVVADTGATVATCRIADTATMTRWDPADGTDCTGDSDVTSGGALAPGAYMLRFQVEDEAGNWSPSYAVFWFYYGPLAVDDVRDVRVTPQDGAITVAWDPPADPRYAYAGIYVRPANGDGKWNHLWSTPDATVTEQVVRLKNGVPRQVMVVAFDADGRPGNQVIAPCVYTPGPVPVTDCGSGSGGEPDAGMPDAGMPDVDAGMPDAGAGMPDAGMP